MLSKLLYNAWKPGDHTNTAQLGSIGQDKLRDSSTGVTPTLSIGEKMISVWVCQRVLNTLRISWVNIMSQTGVFFVIHNELPDHIWVYTDEDRGKSTWENVNGESVLPFTPF